MSLSTVRVLVLAMTQLGCVQFALGDATRVSDDRHATVSATGATAVHIVGRAGELKVHGRSGIDTVTITGTARASSQEAL